MVEATTRNRSLVTALILIGCMVDFALATGNEEVSFWVERKNLACQEHIVFLLFEYSMLTLRILAPFF